MNLNPDFIISSNLQEYFVDKDTGFPLSGGIVRFWSDVNRDVPKTVYKLSGDPANYSYVPIGAELVLSSVGTFQDPSTFQDIKVYYYALDSDGNDELYFVEVYSSTGVPQFTREAWPNPTSGQDDAQAFFNLIPNGQFLAHTDLPEDKLVGGTNVLAQGGWSFELPETPLSTNTAKFIPLQYTELPSKSPRYELQIECTNFNSLDDIKNLRIKFYDVNKFSAPGDQLYTFGFWAEANVNVPVSIQIYKYFGTTGTVLPPTVVDTDTIIPGGKFSSFQFSFGSNAGYSVDTEANNDFVAIDIAFPASIGFRANLTDFALVEGSVTLTEFPLQTDADMIARGVFGWTDTPKTNGFDLYLPPVLTRYGMTFDRSSIGKIEHFPWDMGYPDIAGPYTTSNTMPCDGKSYAYDGYSVLGVPFARLGQELITRSPIDGIPMFGTGADFVTAYKYEDVPDVFRLPVNSAGLNIPAASDGNTGWNFKSIVTYGVSTTGSDSIGYKAYSNVANTLIAIGNFVIPVEPIIAGTSGFTVTKLDEFSGIVLGQQYYGFTVLCVPALNLVAGSGNPGKYFQFANDTLAYTIWFFINGEIQPTVADTDVYIRVDLRLDYSAQDVANIVREVINAYQISEIEVTSVPTFSQYWLFSSNPAALVQYYVWYRIDGNGLDPLISGRIGIPVDIFSADDISAVTEKTWRAIDKYRYAAPDFRGMFLRNADFSGVYDKDVAQRWSSISGLSGANYGTFEFEQFLNHRHWTDQSTRFVTDAADSFAFTTNAVAVTTPLYPTGGSETRPVNAYVNMIIRY